ncbi:MAG: 1-acyl-sn-glycerol-3-phosphate acyltransferase [Actinobacteria bacterium]|nr:1-acyl-sn-glycerol-3-phosphate acyltransferase [Actinomycetota bacterium]MCB9428171.1 1-acyl-sn-glycerol-3-phosphate acyltransferase [Actinomycetota bacterium]MCO5300250.1 1-acyl-sn-glycerol-3-phosphate acyltransferase [Candidatus Nanopelagicales bacterium]HPQ83432.1 lysophospholipid acyltransferase family protein [Actinomycetota bacterium]HRV65210.1 lysophospholipid acyltransferase family protein [Candidatus Nanopelagicales bacterium]
MLSRHGPEHLGLSFRFAVSVLKPPLTVFTRRDWQGSQWLRQEYPPSDGLVVAANHLSWFDPLPMAHLLWDNGRPPRFLGKESVFKVPLVGQLLLNCGQIPVYRDTDGAADSVRAAVAAVEAGEAVVVYPEGTITRDPELWPMSAKTGAARIALLGNVPVVPVAQWGPQRVMRPYVKEFNVLPPKTMHMRVGPPVDLDDLRGREINAALLAQATDRIMDAVTEQLEHIRGESSPPERLDFRSWREANTTQEEQ